MNIEKSHSATEAQIEEQEHHGLSHVVPLKLLFAVFVTLLFLTWLTWDQSYWNLGGSLNLYVALAIAATKASLVILFFMHLFWERGFNLMILLSCIFFVALFIAVTLTDAEAYKPLVHWQESPLVEKAQQEAKDKKTAATAAPALTPATSAPAAH